MSLFRRSLHLTATDPWVAMMEAWTFVFLFLTPLLILSFDS